MNSVYLDSIQHGAGLLQRHCSPCLKGFCRVGHLHQPFAQLLHHFSVTLPLADQTVNDTPPLLSTPHYALPLVTQESQLQVELISAGEGSRMIVKGGLLTDCFVVNKEQWIY